MKPFPLNAWYAAAYDVEVKAALLSRTICGQKMVKAEAPPPGSPKVIPLRSASEPRVIPTFRQAQGWPGVARAGMTGVE